MKTNTTAKMPAKRRMFEDILIFDKRKVLFGAILALVSVLVHAIFYSWENGLMYGLFFLLFGALRFKEKNTWFSWALYGMLFVVFVSFFCSLATGMTTGGREFSKLAPKQQWMNIFIIMTMFSLVFACLANARRTLITTAVLLTIFMTANYFIYTFRGKELCALDFLSLATAANVASQYKFVITDTVAEVWTMLALYIFLAFSLPKSPDCPRLRSRFLALTLAVVMSCCVIVNAARVTIMTWGDQGSAYNGYFLNFYLGVRDSFIAPPDGYSKEMIAELEKEYGTEAATPTGELPNVIVIMNESLADFGIFGKDILKEGTPTPFMSSLSQNTIFGHALTSVFGGNTANAEFEFLSGGTMAFLPNGSVAYQQYVGGPMAMLAKVLKTYGYEALATHPYHANGWGRDRIYPMIGFTESTFLDSYPMKDVLRSYVSDREMYQRVLDKLDACEERPLFMFGITMQNHGGYDYAGNFWPGNTELTAMEGDYPLAEQYATLLSESDKAFEFLLTELSKRPEKTILLMFGDHMPSIENAFYNELNGGEFKSLEDKMKKYAVPFYIWTNYDSEEGDASITSLNFLSMHLFELAGIPQTPLMRFMADMRKVIPAMNALGYYSIEQDKFVEFDEATETEKMWLDRYAALQYNHLFDKANRSEVFFGQYLK